LLFFLNGIFLFYISFINTDNKKLEAIRKEAYDNGKKEVTNEIYNQKNSEEEQKKETEEIDRKADNILTGIHNLKTENSLCNKFLIFLAKEIGIVQGIMYTRNIKEQNYTPIGEYAITERKPLPFKDGEGLPGQVAENKTMMVLYDIPENYFNISSGLGNSQPKFLILVPVLYKNDTISVLELAFFKKPDISANKILDKVLAEVGHKLHKFITARENNE
jgi:hypothetical protein